MDQVEVLNQFTSIEVPPNDLLVFIVIFGALLVIGVMIGISMNIDSTVLFIVGIVAPICLAVFLYNLIPPYNCYQVSVNEYAKLSVEQQKDYIVYDNDGTILYVYELKD